MDPVEGVFLPLDRAALELLWKTVGDAGHPRSPEGAAAWVRSQFGGKRVAPPVLRRAASFLAENPDAVRTGLEIASQILTRRPRT